MDNILRLCAKCLEEKDESCFSVSSRRKDGSVTLHKACKPCRSRQNADRNKERYDNEPEYRERLQKYKENNPEKCALWRKREYENNRERYLRNNSEWAKKNRARSRQIKRRYKLKRKEWELSGNFSQEEWQALLDATGNKCLACGKHDVLLTQDHVIPLSKGGLNIIENIQPLCGPCNSSKHTKTTDYRKG